MSSVKALDQDRVRTPTEPRASLKEVRGFCNRVREAGGGELLGALLPGKPAESDSCLIALNLNFECEVSFSSPPEDDPLHRSRWMAYDDGEQAWFMFVADNEVHNKIADALGLETVNTLRGPSLLLPREIGRVASAYDEWFEKGREAGDLEDSEFWPLLDHEWQQEYLNEHHPGVD